MPIELLYSMGIIYCYHNVINGKKYIGQTINESQRRSYHKTQHTRVTQSNNKFVNALKKHGFDSFIYGVIEECNNESLDERERYYIDLYNSQVNGYNTLKGGTGQCNPTPYNLRRCYYLIKTDGDVVVTNSLNKYASLNGITYQSLRRRQLLTHKRLRMEGDVNNCPDPVSDILFVLKTDNDIKNKCSFKYGNVFSKVL